MLTPFHLAIPVHDLAAAREFYGGLFGCREGRAAATWVDFDFFGHQFVCHVSPQASAAEPHFSGVDGKAVPVPHFGVVLPLDDWQQLADRLTAAGVTFQIEPYTRFVGQPGEQGTFFLFDPSGNAVEIKGFRDLDQLFAT